MQRVNYKEPNHVANRGTVIFAIARSKRKAVETNQKSDQASVARAFEFPVAGAVSKPDPVAHSVTVPAKCCTNGVSKCETQLIADSSPVNEPDERALRVADQVTYGQPDCVAVTFADTSSDSFDRRAHQSDLPNRCALGITVNVAIGGAKRFAVGSAKRVPVVYTDGRAKRVSHGDHGVANGRSFVGADGTLDNTDIKAERLSHAVADRVKEGPRLHHAVRVCGDGAVVGGRETRLPGGCGCRRKPRLNRRCQQRPVGEQPPAPPAATGRGCQGGHHV